MLNVFFLWVAGGNIEERWGAPLTLGAYLSGGAAGAFAQAVYAGRELAVTGASASVAGLMGAFLIRHIRGPVRVFWLFFPLFTVRFGTCTVPAWAVPALWFLQHLAVEVFTQGGTSGAGYWAHGGGLAAGVLLASFIRTTTAAQMAEQAAEPLPAALDRTVGSAENLIALKEYAAAERMLAGVISDDPDHVRAHHALMRLAYEAGDWPRYAQRAVALMRREWERGDLASLRRTLDQALSVIGGAPLPSDALVQLALFCEKLERWEQALLLHRKVLERNPRSPHSLFAAGRILHERLGRPAEARRYFTTLAAPPYDVEWGDAVRRYLT